jgi:hypothetical protein
MAFIAFIFNGSLGRKSAGIRCAWHTRSKPNFVLFSFGRLAEIFTAEVHEIYKMHIAILHLSDASNRAALGLVGFPAGTRKPARPIAAIET